MATTQGTFYVIGGTLQRNARSYVRRQADDKLYEALTEGKFCYVLTSRQMGKSSLMVRAAIKLRAEGAQVAVLDLTALGQNLTPEQWYDGMLARIGQQLKLEDELEDFWLDHAALGALQRWMRAVREVVLQHCRGRVVIFIDEIDAVRSLPFSTDEFFAAIRELYNRRTEDAELNRLTFCLLGVATPTDLIQDTRTTPFNIGQRIELTDFTPIEALTLTEGMCREESIGRKLLQRIIYWTGGHPYLTQRLCQAVAADVSIQDTRAIDRLCDALFLSSGARERDDNLLFVRERLLRSEADLTSLLDLYAQVRKGKAVRDEDTNPLVSILKLAGIVRVEDGNLCLRNRIYEWVFDRDWIAANIPGAELRRQRVAYRKGVWRAAAIAAMILVLAGLALATLVERNRTAKALATVQEEKRLEAEEALENLRIEKNRADEAAAELQLALENTRREKQRADENAARADQSAREAQRRAEKERAALQQFQKARAETEATKVEAEIAKQKMEAKRIEAENQSEFNRHLLYASEMRVAQQAFDNGELQLFRETLAQQTPEQGKPELRGIEWDYLDHGATKVIGESAPIKSLAFSPDSRTLASGGDGFLKLRDTQSGREHQLPLASDKTVTSLVFSADGKYLAASYTNQGVALWDIETDKEIVALQKHKFSTYSVTLSPDGKLMASGSGDNTAKIYEVGSQQERFTLDKHTNTVNAVAFSPDGKLLASASSDSTIKLWDVNTGKELQTLTGHRYAVNTIAFSPDGNWLASGSLDRKVKLWKVSTGEESATLSSSSEIQSLAFSPDGKRLIAGNHGQQLTFWDVSTGQVLLVLKSHQKAVQTVAFSPNGKQIVSGSDDRTIRLLDTQPELEIRALKNEPPPRSLSVYAFVNAVAFSPDAKKVISGDAGNRTKLWDIESGKESLFPNGHTASVSAVSYSPDGKLIATSSSDKTAKIRDAESGEVLQTLTGHTDKVSSLAFSPDGTMLATCSGDKTVRLWEPRTGKLVDILPGHTDQVPSVTFSADGKRLAAGGLNGVVKIWETTSRKEIGSFAAHDKSIVSLAFSPDGRRLVTGSTDNLVKVWDVEKQTLALTLKGHQGEVHRVLFSHDGKQIITTGTDGMVRVWDAESGQEQLLLRGHQASIQWFDLSRDGKRLVTGSSDGTIKVWDMQRLLPFSQP